MTASTSSQPRGLRILMGCDTFAPDINGAASFTERLSGGLIERGNQVRVVAPATSRRTSGKRAETVAGQPISVYRLPSWRWYPHDWLRFCWPWTVPAHARRILDEFEPDVVHIQSHLIVGRALAREAHQRGIRVVATNHIMPANLLDFTMLPGFLNKILVKWACNDAHSILSLAEFVTTPTPKAAEFLHRETGLTGIIPVSCGLRAADYVPDLEPKDAPRIVFVGRLTTEKQIDVLIRAFSTLDPGMGARLQIVGGGDQAVHLEHLTHDLDLDDRVEFMGRISDALLRDTYTRATVFVMPSIAELQSIATMEAMASGLPIIAANAVALPHLVVNGENGYLFEPSSAEDLADKLRTVLGQSRAERVRMQKASLERVQVHDIVRTIATFESLYRGVRPGSPTPGSPSPDSPSPEPDAPRPEA